MQWHLNAPSECNAVHLQSGRKNRALWVPSYNDLVCLDEFGSFIYRIVSLLPWTVNCPPIKELSNTRLYIAMFEIQSNPSILNWHKSNYHLYRTIFEHDNGLTSMSTKIYSYIEKKYLGHFTYRALRSTKRPRKLPFSYKIWPFLKEGVFLTCIHWCERHGCCMKRVQNYHLASHDFSQFFIVVRFHALLFSLSACVVFAILHCHCCRWNRTTSSACLPYSCCFNIHIPSSVNMQTKFAM